MKRIFLMTIILCFLSFSNLNAQSNYHDITSQFFKLFEQDPIKAMDYAFSTNKWMEQNKDGTDYLKTNYQGLLPHLGEYYGYEKITEKKITDRFIIVSFLLRYDRQPMRFSFVMYKPKDDWKVQNLNYDDNLDDEIEESVKQNN